MHGNVYSSQAVDGSVLTLEAVSPWRKYRVQVPLALLSAVFCQTLLAGLQSGFSFWSPNLQGSILIALLANGGGLLWYRNIRHFPGTRRLAFLFPVFTCSWMIALFAAAAVRIPYSSSQLAVGAIAGIGLSVLFNVLLRRPVSHSFLVIPSMRVNATLPQIPGLPYKLCSDIEELVTSNDPIIVDLQADLTTDWDAALVEATLKGRKVYHIKQVKESLTGRVQIDHLSENALGTLAPDESYAFVRSAIERVVALGLLLALSPLFLVSAIAIKVDSAGPALFRQSRIGLGGKKFTIFKFRTMRHVVSSGSREADITQENDPRITRLGDLMRKSRIDELPQLINVLKGEMSFIGPRPETENLSDWYAGELEFYAYRHVVPPGITGWAQVRQGHVASTEDVFQKLQYDFYYIKNFSFWLDVVIVFETVKVILLRLGAK